FWQKQRMKANDRSEPWQFTPALDKMAESGAMLTNHYCSAPVCAPSRASLLLGVSQGHANIRNNQFDKELQDTYTLSSVLKQAGYHTSLVGKWGLQGSDAEAPNWPAHPLNRGFDYSYAYIRHRDGHEHYPKEGIYRGKKEVWENKTDVSAGLDKSFTTDLWTAKAKDIIKKQAATKKPFFMYLAYDVPHAVLELPTQAYPAGGGLNGGLQWLGNKGKMINTASGTPDSYIHPDYLSATYDHDKNPSTPEVAWPDVYKRYASLCRRIDDGVGDIMQLLKDLKIDQNTMVVFTSDNGPSVESYLPEEYEPVFFNSFGPFDGIKRDVWEGGIRMPTLVQWSGAVPAGKVVAEPSAHYDWLATFAAAAGVPAPARTDGVSLLPMLTGQGKQKQGLVYIEYENNGTTPGFDEFSPNHRKRRRNQMQKIRLGDFVGVRYDIKSAADDFEIYNVVTDPQETKNLAGQDAFASMQRAFKDKVTQVRRPDSEAPRPYDLEPMAAQETTKLTPGVRWMTHEGEFPWVADLSDRPTSQTGVSSEADIRKNPMKEGMICQMGYLKIPKDGTYQFSMDGNGSYVLKLHDALVLDRSYPDDPRLKLPISATVQMKAGYHPFKIFYHQTGNGKPALDWTWQTDGVAQQAIPASALFHSAD
ncbi:sulfatase-like hydrolase/transferase, partial [Persicitalea sp.]|uniref:sulfatase-like hydrolase/transferase n=1 Tax=Persicitalea sp. TaxID=3100273 RepID=UPI0035933E6B